MSAHVSWNVLFYHTQIILSSKPHVSYLLQSHSLYSNLQIQTALEIYTLKVKLTYKFSQCLSKHHPLNMLRGICLYHQSVLIMELDNVRWWGSHSGLFNSEKGNWHPLQRRLDVRLHSFSFNICRKTQTVLNMLHLRLCLVFIIAYISTIFMFCSREHRDNVTIINATNHCAKTD